MNFWSICEYVHLAHYWSKHIRLNSQSSVTSAEQTVPSLGKVSVLETNAFECSLCTEMENYRIKMCNCKGNKMRKETSKNRNIYKYIYIYIFQLSLPYWHWQTHPWTTHGFPSCSQGRVTKTQNTFLCIPPRIHPLQTTKACDDFSVPISLFQLWWKWCD